MENASGQTHEQPGKAQPSVAALTFAEMISTRERFFLLRTTCKNYSVNALETIFERPTLGAILTYFSGLWII